MPTYLYLDDLKHQAEITHRMFYTTAVVCEFCQQPMHRVPTLVRVNWNGDRGGRIHPQFKQWLNGAAKRREDYLSQREESKQNGNRN